MSPVGTDTQNGTALLNALASITTASATNTWLLKIEPGTYDLGSSSLGMKEWVDIEGSGELATKIKSSDVVIWGTNNAELRFLTAESAGGASAKAIWIANASPRLTHITARALASGGGYTIAQGVTNDNASPTMTDVTAWASGGRSWNTGVANYSGSMPTLTNVTASAVQDGYQPNYGVYNSSSSPIMVNVFATGDGMNGNDRYGMYNYNSSPTIRNSSIVGKWGYGIYNTGSDSSYTAKIDNSQISGGRYAAIYNTEIPYTVLEVQTESPF
ncbi:MAG: hypothetical protein HY673_12970 [Chloroflexi bacterium]|nr:hypothetical protein [Chloroflexota bacterium]